MQPCSAVNGKGKGKRRTSLPEKDRCGIVLPQRVATHYSQNPFFIEDSTCNASFLRAKYGIEIVDWETEQECLENMPMPIFKLEYAPFGDAVKEQLKRRYHAHPDAGLASANAGLGLGGHCPNGQWQDAVLLAPSPDTCRDAASPSGSRWLYRPNPVAFERALPANRTGG